MYRDGVDFRFTLIACLVEETKPEKKKESKKTRMGRLTHLSTTNLAN